MTRLLTLAAVVLAALQSSGCTFYSLDERYVSPVEQAHPARVTVLSSEWTRLAMIGALGVPLIPYEVDLGGPSRFSLSMFAEVAPGEELSLDWRPCLAVDQAAPLCASHSVVKWTSARPEEPRKGTTFSHQEEWSRYFLDPKADPAPLRVTRAALDERVPGSAEGSLRVEVHAFYSFRCDGTCPESFELNGVSFARESTHYYAPFVLGSRHD